MSLHRDREDWESENLRGDAYEAVNMIVSNSALDMRSVVVHVLSEALNRYSVSVRLIMCVYVYVCGTASFFLFVCKRVCLRVLVCILLLSSVHLHARVRACPPVCMTICLSDLTRRISANLHARPCLSAHS